MVTQKRYRSILEQNKRLRRELRELRKVRTDSTEGEKINYSRLELGRFPLELFMDEYTFEMYIADIVSRRLGGRYGLATVPPVVQRTTEQEKNRFKQASDRILEQYKATIGQRKQEDLVNLEKRRQAALKLYPDKEDWKIWVNSLYDGERKWTEQFYEKDIKGTEELVKELQNL